MNKQRIVIRELDNAAAYAASDPSAALAKIRFVAEALTDILAAKAGTARQAVETQETLLRRLEKDGVIDSSMARPLHDLRMIGNKGVHEMSGTVEEAKNAVACARLLASEIIGTGPQASAAAAASGGTRKPGSGAVSERLKVMGATTQRSAAPIHPLPLGWRDFFALAPGKSGIAGFLILLVLAVAALFTLLAAPVWLVRNMVAPLFGDIAANVAGALAFLAVMATLGWIVAGHGPTRWWRAALAPPAFGAGLFALWLLLLGTSGVADSLTHREPSAPNATANYSAAPPAPVARSSSDTQPSPSFSCAGTLTFVEQQICSSPDLATLDQQIAAAYRVRLAVSGASRARLVREQRKWIRSRGACLDIPCIEAAYGDRLVLLRDAAPATEAPTAHDIILADTNAMSIWSTSAYSYAGDGGGPGGGLADDRLRVGGWGDVYVSLIKFDYPSDGRTVQSAVLVLKVRADDARSQPTPLGCAQLRKAGAGRPAIGYGGAICRRARCCSWGARPVMRVQNIG
jgi:uncharacterized protein YecT (DUF1311 family)